MEMSGRRMDMFFIITSNVWNNLHSVIKETQSLEREADHEHDG